MGRKKLPKPDYVDTPPFPPAQTKEERERQLIMLATDVAEKQMRDGTASSQVIAHYLKLGTAETDYRNELLKARTEQIEQQTRIEELYAEAIKAMKSYSGESDEDL